MSKRKDRKERYTACSLVNVDDLLKMCPNLDKYVIDNEFQFRSFCLLFVLEKMK